MAPSDRIRLLWLRGSLFATALLSALVLQGCGRRGPADSPLSPPVASADAAASRESGDTPASGRSQGFTFVEEYRAPGSASVSTMASN